MIIKFDKMTMNIKGLCIFGLLITTTKAIENAKTTLHISTNAGKGDDKNG